MMKRIGNCCLLGVALICAPASGFALGIRVPDQDARAVARGNAFAATADNPSAIFYNPAGITQLEGMNGRYSLYSIYIKDHYNSGATSLDSKDTFGFLPQLFSTWTPKDSRFSFGFGTYSPYGLSMEWPSSAPFHYVSRQGSLMSIAGNVVVAWKVADNLSIAAGPTVMWSKARLEQDGSSPPFPRSGDVRLRGDGFGFGATAGLLWKPHEKHAFGVNYRSRMDTDWSGSLNMPIPGALGTRSAKAEFNFPHTIVGGWSFRPTPKWNLEFNLDWTGWSCVKTVPIRTSPPAPPPLVFNWQDSFMYEFGATRDLGKGWALSAGYIYSQSSVPAALPNFKPTVPDSDRHVFSVGVGHQGKKVSWDLAYQFAYGPERTIPGLAGFGGGNYTFYSHAITCSFGYHF